MKTMRTFVKNLAFGLIVGIPLLLIAGAATVPAQTQKTVITIMTQTTDTINPVPSPSPEPTMGSAPVPAPPVTQPSPDVPNPGESRQFPSPTPHLVVPTPGATPTMVTPPQANVFIGLTCDSACSNDKNTGGVIGPAPLTLTWHATFQGGFSGVPAMFIWSDGHVGPDDTVTYATTGLQHGPSVKVQQIYNGVTYEVGAANPSTPFTVQ